MNKRLRDALLSDSGYKYDWLEEATAGKNEEN